MDDLTRPDEHARALQLPIATEVDPHGFTSRRPWDARAARWLVAPLVRTRVTPNDLTTIRLLVGLAAAAAFWVGTFVWSNVAALLLVLSNFLDHTDGELARMTGKSSRFGHAYDMACDAVVTVLFFIAIGAGIDADSGSWHLYVILGAVAGVTVALIFFMRVRMESLAGKAATRQASLVGFETEDVLYLIPLVTLCNGLVPFLWLASTCAPAYAIKTALDYRRIPGKLQPLGDNEERER